VPLSNFVRRCFGFVHHSIAILYHQVPNLSITIRNFLIAVRQPRATSRDTRNHHTTRYTGPLAYSDAKVANRNANWGLARRDREWSLIDGQIPNPNVVRVAPGTGYRRV
jgi:hypothetical protein